MTDRLGQQLGNYRLTQFLGRGGFAEVYLGEHVRLNTQAALKVLHTSLEEDDAGGFLREAQMVARLRHPHIVRVFDFDVENHTPFLVMDYLPNGNVRRSHPKGMPLPLQTLISYVTQVASALQYAHDEKRPALPVFRRSPRPCRQRRMRRRWTHDQLGPVAFLMLELSLPRQLHQWTGQVRRAKRKDRALQLCHH
ncbi:MAG TPA: protein kinase, partial [Ktedonobacteraceae bacterium]|nr:protein kinase [Ktedonobacteraceae bacterium]